MHGASDQQDPSSTAAEAAKPRFRPRPWEHLETPYDVEIWIEEHNRGLQEHIRPGETGYGICFHLAEGGQVYMQTSADGAVILDVTADAEWIAPLICAAAQVAPSASSLWILPDDKLIQLVLGMSSLIESSTLVAGHPFGTRLRRTPLARGM